MPLEQLLPLAAQSLGALARMGGEPHLSLSPSSLVIPADGTSDHGVVLVGAGLNTLLPAYSPRDKNAPYFGSPEFMAPELCSGKGSSTQSDLYSVALVLYIGDGKGTFQVQPGYHDAQETNLRETTR